jgi:CHASE2 domain-containing sensor protein
VRTTGPYIGLDYFVEDDADLFFGREAERKKIIGNLRASRLTLLYAESGVGKSSLLRAGVAARLRELASRSLAEGGSARYFPVVFSSWRGDSKVASIAALEAAGRSVLGDDMELSLRRDSLEHAIEDVVAAVDATPLVILDQFEEHFLYEPRDEEGFDDELARCVNRRDLRVHFLISVREDAYSLIGDRFKARIPNVYGNYLQLEFLDERAARAAVLQPVEVFNKDLPEGAPRFSVEPELVDAVLEQVRRGRVTIGDDGGREVSPAGPAPVETAYLQLVMKRLWDEEITTGSRQLQLQTLRRLGGADTIVRSHLDDVLAELPGDQQDSTAAAFRFLVTSSGRKIALSSDELREFSDAPAGPLEPALEHLERERILRPIPSSEPDGVSRREIYHDVLAPAILDWRRRHVEERRRQETERGLKQARERARRLEVRNGRLAATVIGLAAVAIGLALYLWNPKPVQRLELKTVDARFSVRGARSGDPSVVVVAVDDKTLRRFDRERTGLLPRTSYARLLSRLSAAHPDVIAVNVGFIGRRTPVRGDRKLLEAIRAMRDRLVLTFADFTVVSGPERTTVQPELLGRPGAIAATGVRAGLDSVPTDVDGRIRRADYEITLTEDASADTLAFAAADVVRGGALRPNELPSAARRASGSQSERTTWIDFWGPAGTIPRVSAGDVLAERVAAGAFRDKRVVVGTSTNLLRTPFGRMRGDEVQANALDTMLRGAPLRDAPLLLDILAIVALGALPAAALLVRRPLLAGACVVASAVLFLVVVQLAFNAGRVVAVVVPLVGLLVATLGVVGLAVARVVRRRRGASIRGSSGVASARM